MTRFYLPSSGSPDVAPSYTKTGWDRVLEETTAKAVITKINSAMTAQAGKGTGVTAQNALYRTYLSAPLEAQSISGTVKGILRCAQTANANNLMPCLALRVVSGDGATIRGTLLAPTTSALSNEWVNLTHTNRKFPVNWAGAGAAISTVSAQAGDRIAIELGHRQHSTNTSGTLPGIVFGDDSPTDLAENETGTTADNPFIDFSATITFQGAGGPQNKAIVSATETDAAQDFSYGTQRHFNITNAVESNQAVDLDYHKPIVFTLVPGLEADTAEALSLILGNPTFISITSAAETGIALALSVTIEPGPPKPHEFAWTFSQIHKYGINAYGDDEYRYG